MIKKISCYLILLTIFVACKDDQVGIVNYARKIDMSKSSLSTYQLKSAFLYSTDGGATFVAFPTLKNGQTYQAKVVYNPDPDNNTFPDDGSISVVNAHCFAIDWSASNPQPTSVDPNTGIATFAVGGANSIVVSMVDIQNPPFYADDAAGTYSVVKDDWADFKAGDKITVEKIDDTHVKIVEYPATTINHAPLVITITDANKGTVTVSSQDSGAYTDPSADEETTSGTGTVSSCGGTIDLTLKFVVAGTSYTGNVFSLRKVN